MHHYSPLSGILKIDAGKVFGRIEHRLMRRGSHFIIKIFFEIV
jgi:hypothetical protein